MTLLTFIFIVTAFPAAPHYAAAAELPTRETAQATAPPRAPGDVSLLTGPTEGAPLAIVQAYIQEHAAELGLGAADLEDVIVTSQYTDAHNGVTHIYMQQRYRGIEVVSAYLSTHVTANGSIINLYSSFVGNLAGKVNATEAALAASDAVFAAGAELGLSGNQALAVLEGEKGPDRQTLLSKGSLSARPIPVKLVYQPVEDGLALAWQSEIETLDYHHYWVTSVDALSGQVLSTVDRVVHDTFGPAEGQAMPAADHLAGVTASQATPVQNITRAPDAYEVFALPSEYPDDGPRVVVTNPADATASPFGWHDTNGAAGAEFTLSRGNNVNAYQDQDNDGNAEPGEQPDGGATLDFTGALVPLNLANDPLTYVNASITNLFYWSNIIHDVFYQYGFDEAAGNFQANNYGNGGLGNDSVQAQGQDGSDVNNANFLTLADGQEPRMQMFLFNVTTPRRDADLDSSVIVHEYGHGISNRLTGGPAIVNCLENNEQMGEGWSDFLALAVTAKASDTANTLRGIGTYVLGQPTTGVGIRPAQYTYDMSVNNYTYGDLASMAIPHGVGFIWATMTWDMYWNLVNEHGYNPDFYQSWNTGGNNLAIQLIMDGMKLQSCSPGFVDGRNAILQADVNLTGGANQCAIWDAFARRGLGFSASQGSNDSTNDGTPAFDIPPACGFVNVLPPSQQICAGMDADFSVDVGEGFTGNVILSVDGNPPPTTAGFTPNPVDSPGSSLLTIGNTAGASAGLYTIVVTGTDATISESDTADLDVQTTAPGAPAPLSPPNGASGTSTAPTLSWNPVAGALDYTVEVATDSGFSNIIHTNTVSGTVDSISGLSNLTTYYWRVRANNSCGTGADSTVFSFTTGQEFCSADPITIPGASTSGPASPYPSEIIVSGTGTSVSDVNVRLSGLSHTWPDDIDMLLVGPQGQNLIFMSDAGGGTDVVNVDLSFDDSAASTLPDDSAIGSGTFQPTNIGAGDIFAAPAPAPTAATTLATFNGTDPNGTWSLYASDDTGSDSGSMTGWCLEIETVGGTVDLSIAKTESIDPVIPGSGAGNLTYVISVTNQGPDPASNVTVDEALVLPGDVTLDGVVASAGSYLSPTWTIPSLSVGASEQLTLTLTAGAGAPAGTDIISNTVTITGADGTVINTGDDSATENTSIDDETRCGLSVGTHTFNQTTRPVTITVNTLGTLDCITVTPVDGDHPNAPSGIAGTSDLFWDISAIGGGFDVDVTFPADTVVGASHKTCRTDDNGSNWDCQADADGAPNTISRENVTDFSEWQNCGSCGPTAVRLQQNAAQGQLTIAIWLAGVLSLAAITCLVWRRSRNAPV